MDLDLNDKTVVITGGSKGIGHACARTFAAEGAKVVLAARSATDLNDAAATVHATTGATVSTLPVDLSDEAGQRALAEAVGAVSVVVNNPGPVPPGSPSAVYPHTWRPAWDPTGFGHHNPPPTHTP